VRDELVEGFVWW